MFKGAGKSFGKFDGGKAGVPIKLANSFGTGGKFDQEDRSRDWYCGKCSERNFAKRGECHKCQSLKPEDGGAAPPPLPETGTVLTGMVKSYNRKGFGFIMCLNGSPQCQDIYYSRENLHESLQTRDIPGEHVKFEIQRFPDGKLVAKNVRPVNELPPTTIRAAVSSSAPRMMAPKGAGADEEDRTRDWKCDKCGERNFVKRFQCFKCKNNKPHDQMDDRPAPRRTVSPHAGSRAVKDAMRAKMGLPPCGRSRSRGGRSSGSSSSSSSSRPRKKKKGKRKRSSSSGSSSSKSSKSSKGKDGEEGTDADGSAAAEAAALKNPEVEAAKAENLAKLMKLRDIQPVQARMKEYRELLRHWHPNKNPEKVEVATAVFQFLQKAKPMIMDAK